MKLMTLALSILLSFQLGSPQQPIRSLEEAMKEIGLAPMKMKDVEDALNHAAIKPLAYLSPDDEGYEEDGQPLGYPASTLYIDGVEFLITDLRDKILIDYDGRWDDELEEDEKEPLKVIDYELLDEVLEANEVAYVGANRMNAFFGHYYDLTGTGVFNPIEDYGVLGVGSEVVITDAEGRSRGYEITQILEILHPEQERHFYNMEPLSSLAYYGNGDDMVYIQYCRWDIELGLLISGIGYRVW